jgi:hypothetical protein
MMKVIGEISPCHSPLQNPATRPSLSAVFSTEFGPGAQLERAKSRMSIHPKQTVLFMKPPYSRFDGISFRRFLDDRADLSPAAASLKCPPECVQPITRPSVQSSTRTTSEPAKAQSRRPSTVVSDYNPSL